MKIFLWIRYKRIFSFIVHDISWKEIPLFLTPTVFHSDNRGGGFYPCLVSRWRRKRKKKEERREDKKNGEKREGSRAPPKFGMRKRNECNTSRNLIRVTTRNSSDCTRNARCIKATNVKYEYYAGGARKSYLSSPGGMKQNLFVKEIPCISSFIAYDISPKKEFSLPLSFSLARFFARGDSRLVLKRQVSTYFFPKLEFEEGKCRIYFLEVIDYLRYKCRGETRERCWHVVTILKYIRYTFVYI